MKAKQLSLRLLLLGVGPRLMGAALVVVLIWVGFFCATSMPGAV